MVPVGSNDAGKSPLLRCLDLAPGTPTAQLHARVTADGIRDPASPFTPGYLTGDGLREEGTRGSSAALRLLLFSGCPCCRARLARAVSWDAAGAPGAFPGYEGCREGLDRRFR